MCIWQTDTHIYTCTQTPTYIQTYTIYVFVYKKSCLRINVSRHFKRTLFIVDEVKWGGGGGGGEREHGGKE